MKVLSHRQVTAADQSSCKDNATRASRPQGTQTSPGSCVLRAILPPKPLHSNFALRGLLLIFGAATPSSRLSITLNISANHLRKNASLRLLPIEKPNRSLLSPRRRRRGLNRKQFPIALQRPLFVPVHLRAGRRPGWFDRCIESDLVTRFRSQRGGRRRRIPELRFRGSAIKEEAFFENFIVPPLHDVRRAHGQHVRLRRHIKQRRGLGRAALAKVAPLFVNHPMS